MLLSESDIGKFATAFQESLLDINQLSGKDSLGIPRWDFVVNSYRYSGTVKLPVRVNNVVFHTPFYFVIEKLQIEEMIYIRPIEGEPYRLGDVYGFFGLSTFHGYKKDYPIILVEGIADWAAVKNYYKYVLAVLTSNVSTKQLFFLSNLTDFVVNGFDADAAGVKGAETSESKFKRVGLRSMNLLCPDKDWGKMQESSFGRESLREIFYDLFLIKEFQNVPSR